MKKQIIITLTFLLCFVAAIAQPGTITNITVSQGTDTNLRLVDILFDLSGSDAAYNITLEVSFDGVNYVAIDNANVTGCLFVAPGNNIHLVWDGRVNHSAQSANLSRIKITATTHLAIGNYFQGGVIFYLDGNGGGLVCAVSDQDGGSGIQWYNGSYTDTDTGATATEIGTGQANTTAIISSQGEGSYAATVCDNYTIGAYSQWFLPSKDELNAMYLNKAVINATALANGGTAFVSAIYWGSSQHNYFYNFACSQYFDDGGIQNFKGKCCAFKVRAVRAF